MFEDKEEVKKAMMDLKLFGLGDFESPEEDILESTFEGAENQIQIFPEHDEISERFTKTLNYGRLPATDRPSLPLTQLAVDQFTGVGLDALGEKLGRLDMARAAEMTRTACVGPSSLVLALLYLDRLRKRNPDYLTSISSADLFLVSMMVASKFLHDDGEEDEVFNDEWAQSGGMDAKEMNKLEIEFLAAIDWRIFVNTEEFQDAVKKVERDISAKGVTARGWATYTELAVLSGHPGVRDIWRMFCELTLRMSALCTAAYTAGLLSLLASVTLLERTPLGPTSVSNSVTTLSDIITASSTSASIDDDSTASFVPETPAFTDNLEDITEVMDSLETVISQPRVTAADLLTASLIVSSLSSGMSASSLNDDFDTDSKEPEDVNIDTTEDQMKANYTRSLWLSEVSFKDGENNTRGHYGGWEAGGTWQTQSNTYSDFNLDLSSVKWKNLMLDAKATPNALSSYLGRCPVLKWGSSWLLDKKHFLEANNQPLSFIPLHG